MRAFSDQQSASELAALGNLMASRAVVMQIAWVFQISNPVEPLPVFSGMAIDDCGVIDRV